MNKIYINAQKVNEFCSEIAQQIVFAIYGDDALVWTDGESSWTDEAQKYFYEKYNEVEYELSRILGIYPRTPKPINAFSLKDSKRLK